mmetsp:Transcript_64220/g.114570  ORF Transcript_64220/g.114570 Transcript_64220/m.114570 type:complete len:202 (+) Transcript_64220:1114-1719(+)
MSMSPKDFLTLKAKTLSLSEVTFPPITPTLSSSHTTMTPMAPAFSAIAAFTSKLHLYRRTTATKDRCRSLLILYGEHPSALSDGGVHVVYSFLGSKEAEKLAKYPAWGELLSSAGECTLMTATPLSGRLLGCSSLASAPRPTASQNAADGRRSQRQLLIIWLLYFQGTCTLQSTRTSAAGSCKRRCAPLRTAEEALTITWS